MVQGVGSSNSRFERWAKNVSPIGAIACVLGILEIGLGLGLHSTSLADIGYTCTAVGGAAAAPGAYKLGQWAIQRFGSKEKKEDSVDSVAEMIHVRDRILNILSEKGSTNYEMDMESERDIKALLKSYSADFVKKVKEDVLEMESISKSLFSD